MMLRGPDMSLDMRLGADFEETAGSDGFEPLTVGVSGPSPANLARPIWDVHSDIPLVEGFHRAAHAIPRARRRHARSDADEPASDISPHEIASFRPGLGEDGS
jgi:hypothetical protein